MRGYCCFAIFWHSLLSKNIEAPTINIKSPMLKKWRDAWSARKSQWLLVRASCQIGDAAWKCSGIPTTGITPPFNSVTVAFDHTQQND